MKPLYNVSFRCFFPERGNFTNHHQTMALRDIEKWIEAYKFTHPNMMSITVKVWMKDGEEQK